MSPPDSASVRVIPRPPRLDPNVGDDASPRACALPARVAGYDVARAIAVLGMVLVDFRHEMLVYDRGWEGLLWLFDALEGKAAALFVLLAGAGLSLRTRADDDDTPLVLRPLLERAALLVGLGLVLAHLWKYDILHFHGVYLLLAIPLIRARTVSLWLLAIATIWIALLLNHELDWTVRPTLELRGAVRHLFFNGLYPVFPWFAFVLVGMAIGRLDLLDDRVRRRTLWIALVVAAVTFALDSLGRHEQRTGALGLGGWASWLLTWPRAPRPLFVVSGCAVGAVVICGCVAVARTDRRWIRPLVATGQLALSVYVAHVVAILVPIHHGLLLGLPIEATLAVALAFWFGAIAFALWWRRRWVHGPFEGLLRQVIGRPQPSPGAGLRARGNHQDRSGAGL